MTRIRTPFSLRNAAAGLAVVALLSVAACSSAEEPTSTIPATTATSQTSAAQTTAAPETTTATTATKPTGDYTDASLAAILTKVTVDGKAASPMPIALVRSQPASAITVEPAACSFAGEGLLPYVKDNPAALATATTLSTGMSLVSLSAADADKLFADRDALLSNPECAQITLTSAGQKLPTTIKAESTEGFGFDDAKIMVSNGGAGDVYGFTGRKGDLIVSVNSADKAQIKAIATQIAAGL